MFSFIDLKLKEILSTLLLFQKTTFDFLNQVYSVVVAIFYFTEVSIYSAEIV